MQVRMPRSTLTSKGQVTVPKAIRDRLGIETGDEISFELRPDGVVEVRALKGSLMDLAGRLKPAGGGVSLDEMETAVRTGGTRE
jgi:antitoxin PrlF